MMTREEAIAVLAESKRQNEVMRDDPSTFWASHLMVDGVKNAERRIEAFDIALSALRPVSRERELEAENEELKERIINWRKYMAPTREQVEKVWRGEWLNFYNDFSTAECNRCGEIYEVSPGETPQENYFNAFKEFYHFCPNCGAPMTDEAVQMVMGRMEAVYGQASD